MLWGGSVVSICVAGQSFSGIRQATVDRLLDLHQTWNLSACRMLKVKDSGCGQ